MSDKKRTNLKPWCLGELETFADFSTWKSSISYDLNAVEEFKSFLEGTWTALSANPLRGQAAAEAPKLDRLLRRVAQYSPIYLQQEIQKESISLESVFVLIRDYYGFQQDEASFMDFIDIQPLPEERHERFFHRLLAHIYDNLLRTEGLQHDGASIPKDEVLSPSLYRLVVLIWLHRIHPGLPAKVKLSFGYELQKMTLKDVRRQISVAIPTLLKEINQSEITSNLISATHQNYSDDCQANFSRSGPGENSRSRSRFGQPQRPQPSRQQQDERCKLCLAMRKPAAHPIEDCRLLTFREKLRIAASVRRIGVEEDMFPWEEFSQCQINDDYGQTEAPLNHQPYGHS